MGEGYTTLVVELWLSLNGGVFYNFGVWKEINALILRGIFLLFRYFKDLPRPKVVRTNPPIPLPVTQVTSRSGQQVTQVTARSINPLQLFGMC